MIPQAQRWWRGAVVGEDVRQTDGGGDCFSACLASILEVPIDGFPNFLASDYEGHWWHRWQAWLYETYRVELIYWEKGEWPDVTTLCWWIGEVYPGSVPHSVIFYKDVFRWDPAPENARRAYAVNEVHSIVAPFSIASVFERKDGPPVETAA